MTKSLVGFEGWCDNCERTVSRAFPPSDSLINGDGVRLRCRECRSIVFATKQRNGR